MKGGLRIGLDALDHRGEAVGALLGEVAGKAELSQDLARVGGKDLARGLARIDEEGGSCAGPSTWDVIHTWLAQPFTLFSGL